jgi:hypothetical protein
MQVKETNSFLSSGALRQEIELPFGRQTLYSDGSTGWMAGMQGVQNLPPTVLQQARGEAFRQLASLLLSDHDSSRTVSRNGDGALEISAKDGESVRLEVDEKSGLPLKVGFSEGGSRVEQIFGEWREVGGIKLPYQWTVMQGGKKFAVVTIEDYKINSGLTQEALGKKP